ncbi:GIN domain-containing protein [Pseudomonas sp. 22526]|uniref:GIN domain-containing protein n=1 Tax=Pseudomonas sp. 22526 TaxID=3453937 RepID=UPI003F843FF5
MTQSSPLTIPDDNRRDSAWERAANYEKEERLMRSVSKIVVKGAVDVVFFRSPVAHLVVAGENQDAIRNIKTRFEGGKLVIEQEGVSISGAGGSIHVSGSGINMAGGTIYVGGRQGGVTMQFNGTVGGVVLGHGRCIVGIALPEAPSIRIKGSGDVTLYDLQQTVLDLGVQGSGDITAFGRVDLLDAEVAGSGDVDASELVATSAKLSVVGSGDIDAYVSNSVKARVAGSGDIVIRGNPPIRDHSVAGSGDIKFKKK